MKLFRRILTYFVLVVIGMGAADWSAFANTLSLPSALKTIEAEAFYGDTSLSEVSLNKNVQTIESRAFADSSLSEIYIPDSISFIAEDAFDGCNLVYVFTDNNEYAQDYVDAHANMVNVKLDSMNEFRNAKQYTYQSNADGTSLITGYTGTATDLVIPSYAPDGTRVKNIKGSTFKDNKSITSLYVPGTCDNLGWYTFSGCTSLKTVYIEDGLYTLGVNCFYNCESLESVRLSNLIDSLWENVFYGCNKLKDIYYPLSAVTIPEYGATPYSGTAEIIGQRHKGPVTQGWAYSHHTALYGSGIETVYIPDGATAIMKDSFWDIESLKDIYIPASVETFDPLPSVYGADHTAFQNIKANITIHGESGSKAEEYASANNIKFVSTGNSSAIPVSSITLNKSSASITIGNTVFLTASVSPSNATNNHVTWSSSNTSVATVSSSGVVTGKAAGTATITVSSTDGSGKRATCTVTVSNGSDYSATNEPTRAPAIGETATATPDNSATNTPTRAPAIGDTATATPDHSATNTPTRAPAIGDEPTLTPSPITAPTTVGTVATYNAILIHWDLVDNAEGYKVYISETSRRPVTAKTVVSKSTNSATIDNLDPGTKYYIWVSAYNASGEATSSSTYQSTRKATTSPEFLQTPTVSGGTYEGDTYTITCVTNSSVNSIAICYLQDGKTRTKDDGWFYNGSSGVTVKKNGNQYTWTFSYSFQYTGSSDSRTVLLRCYDPLGNYDEITSASFTCKKKNAAPTVSLSVSPSTVDNSGNKYFTLVIKHTNTRSFLVSFSGFKCVESYKKSLGQSATNSWSGDLGDAGQSYSSDQQTYKLNFYPEAGTSAKSYNITVKVTGDGGSDSANATITIKEKVAGYDADAAVEYAQYWAVDYLDRGWIVADEGNDCANFVTKCLEAGGLVIPSNAGYSGNTIRHYSGKYIYGESGNDKIYSARTWVPSMLQWFYDNGFTIYENPTKSQISKGDIALTDGQGHVIIITGTDSNGNILFCGHTNDRKNEIIGVSDISYLIKTSEK